MDNAKLLTHFLLAAATLSVAHHKHELSRPTATLTTFLGTEGHSRRIAATRASRKKSVAQSLTYTVTATAYQAVVGQTDDEPFVTADNSRIKPQYSSRTRWLALSQDLLARWGGDFQYGDQVVVRGISPQLDGTYTVHDTMNKRHRHCLDILTHKREKLDIFTKNVKLQLVAATTAPDSSSRTSPARALSLARLRTTPPAVVGRRSPFLARGKRTIYLASAIL